MIHEFPSLRAEQKRAYYLRNREKRIAYAKAWNKANPEKVEVSAKARWEANPEKYAAARKEKRIRQTIRESMIALAEWKRRRAVEAAA